MFWLTLILSALGAFLVLRDGLRQPCTVTQTVGERADGRKVRAIALGAAILSVTYVSRHSEHWIKGWARHCRSTVDREGVSEGSLRDSMCKHVGKAGVG